MPLTPGTTLLHYELVGPLGAGAMGEVWRARDGKLQREVAIKVLPEHFADDEERLARFEREARTLATLNHPNVAQIFGVDQVGETCFLVLELVPGESLDARIERGALPLAEALDVCRQIAAGLEAAHEAGVIHRDLKPANVRVTPDGKVKLLDFGLAKPSAAGRSGSSTDSVLSTEAGRLLGTPTYMAPEQARGRAIDRRVDLWAFGCVLFECLAARRPFAGATLSDVLAAVLEREPDWTLLPAGTPPRVRELLERCLRKDVATRLRDAGDARVALDELAGRIAPPSAARQAGDAAATPARRPARALALVAAGVGLGALVGAALLSEPPAAPSRAAAPLQVVLAAPDFAGLRSAFAVHPTISPDGRLVVYQTRAGLSVRSLERMEVREVPGSAGADGQFWSPTSDAIGFSKDGRLWIWTLDRTESRAIATLPTVDEFNGGAWMPDGSIYFCVFHGDLYAVPATGGVPEVVLAHEPGEIDFHLPARVPGRNELIVVAHRPAGKQELFAFVCDERRRVPLLEMDELSVGACTPDGALVLMRNWTTQDLWIVGYDPLARRVEGKPVPFLPDLQYPSVSDDGALVCAVGDRAVLSDMLLATRDGTLERVPGGPFAGLSSLALSPDGRSIAYSAVNDGNRDLWVLDVARGTRRRLTTDPINDDKPRWSSDGRTLFFERWYPGSTGVYRLDVDGGTPPVLVFDDASEPAPVPDGSALVVSGNGASRNDGGDLWRVPLDGGEPEPVARSASTDDQAAVSPDGRWLAFRSDATGQDEVFVRDLRAHGAALQVSIGGGAFPMWNRAGDALLYVRDDAWYEVPLGAGATPDPQPARRVLDGAALGLVLDGGEGLVGFGLTPDDQRFLVRRRSSDDALAGIVYMRGFGRLGK